MTDTSANAFQPIVASGLPGLETVSNYQIRPLPSMTLFSTANRFLKFDFPPQRDYDLCLLTANKGILAPQFSRNHLLTLPVTTVEQLAAMVLRASAGHEEAATNPLDIILTLIIALEEACQYNLDALLSEDLALLEAHQLGSLHNYYFKPAQTRETMAHLLSSQGYRNDMLAFSPEPFSPAMAYWLCRRLTVVFPWSAILAAFPPAQAETFPYLYRLWCIGQYVAETATLPADLTPVYLVRTLIPRIYQWIYEVFPAFSEKARVPRPVQELVLAEGSTEELLIPAIAKALGHNLDQEGILVQPVGGKNQMLHQYVTHAERLSVPISIVMDQDAHSLLPDLTYYQREGDRIFILEEGEFEDMYALELIVKAVNQFYLPQQALTKKRLQAMPQGNRVKSLQTLWQELGLGVFDKVKFAQSLAEAIQHENHLSPSMKRLVKEILEVKPHAPAVLPG